MKDIKEEVKDLTLFSTKFKPLEKDIEEFLRLNRGESIKVVDTETAIHAYRTYKERNKIKKNVESLVIELTNPLKQKVDKINKEANNVIDEIYRSCRQSLISLNEYVEKTPDDQLPSNIKVTTRYEPVMSKEKLLLLLQNVAEGNLPINLFNLNVPEYNKLVDEGKISKNLMIEKKKINSVTGRNI